MALKSGKNIKEKQSSEESNSQKLTQKQKNYIYTGVFITIVLFLFIVNNYNGEPEEGPYPPYYLESLQNNLRLADQRGKVVLIEFWASWDENSKKIAPDLVDIKNQFAASPFEIIGISIDAASINGQTKANVAAFIKNFDINFPVVHAKRKTMNDYGGIPTLPALFVVDKKGNIVAHHQGLVDKLTLVSEITNALQESEEKGSLVAPDFNLPSQDKLD